jgi:hypothetical protein
MSFVTVSSKILRSARTQLRAEAFRPMTVLSKQSAEEYKKKVSWLAVFLKKVETDYLAAGLRVHELFRTTRPDKRNSDAPSVLMC